MQIKHHDKNDEKKYNITIYTDGACSGNPGKGGWGAILICHFKDKREKDVELKKILSGGEPMTTNNRMELTAVIEALKAVKKSSNIDLFSDSKYVIDGMTKWLENWKHNGWKGSDKKLIKNVELWKELDKLSSIHAINWHWVKGHADDALNNEVDKIACFERDKQ